MPNHDEVMRERFENLSTTELFPIVVMFCTGAFFGEQLKDLFFQTAIDKATEGSYAQSLMMIPFFSTSMIFGCSCALAFNKVHDQFLRKQEQEIGGEPLLR